MKPGCLLLLLISTAGVALSKKKPGKGAPSITTPESDEREGYCSFEIEKVTTWEASSGFDNCDIGIVLIINFYSSKHVHHVTVDIKAFRFDLTDWIVEVTLPPDTNGLDTHDDGTPKVFNAECFSHAHCRRRNIYLGPAEHMKTLYSVTSQKYQFEFIFTYGRTLSLKELQRLTSIQLVSATIREDAQVRDDSGAIEPESTMEEFFGLVPT